MSDEKQYFDRVEVSDSYIWAVDEIEGTKTPIVISAIGYSKSSSHPSEIILQQSDGPWWYSRRKYDSPTDIEHVVSEISNAMQHLRQGS